MLQLLALFSPLIIFCNTTPRFGSMQPICTARSSKVDQVAVAEDLTSTVFLKALRWVEPGRSLKSVRSWLYAAARTTIADYWHTHHQLEVLPLEKAETEAREVQSSTEHETETRTRQRVQQLLALLPPREREILRLRYLHGYSRRRSDRCWG